MKVKGRKVSRTASVPAPVGGWNARDSIAAMPPQDAVILKNWMPLTNDVMLRKGYTDWSTGLSGNVETLMTWNGGSTSMLKAATTSGYIYDVTSQGAVGAAEVSGLTSARWQHCNFTTPAGTYLVCCNGSDAVRNYNGSVWSSPAITGFTSSDSINVMAHMNRLWFIQKNTLKVWYLPISSIAGAASSIDLGPLAERGGYLVGMGSWSMDSGRGMDDHAVFITSEGEVFVYQGSDPTSSATWSLIGRYYIGNPIGYRCTSKFNSDLLIITQTGLEPVSQSLSVSNVQTALTDKIQFAVSSAVSLYSGNFGWEVTIFPKENMLILNVPESTGSSQQYVMNTITGAWANFTGWNAYTFEILGSELFFGATSKVVKAWYGAADGNANIEGQALQSFSDFGSPNQKWFKEARPIFTIDSANVGILLGINVDYDSTPPTGTPTFTPAAYGGWGTAVWGTSLWGQALSIAKNWQTVGNIGYAAGMQLKSSSNDASVHWAGTTYLLEDGYGL